VLFHDVNQGVGGAVITGYRKALVDGADIVVKLDGDGQMDPALIGKIIAPIADGSADYVKGNRFFDLESLSEMPAIRLFGNAVLSFFSKLSSGYWQIFDPTNGFTAIHANVLRKLPLNKLEKRYFFESDMLFRLSTLRAVVFDVPMEARYGEETSSLRVARVIPEFLSKHLKNGLKRLFYNYFLRDFSIASVDLVFGLLLFLGGVFFGSVKWYLSLKTGVAVTSGTVMLAALPTLIGVQLILAFLSFDVSNVPRMVLHKRI
jgi:glycosyltransferase involved in cell wall biosynthesis